MYHVAPREKNGEHSGDLHIEPCATGRRRCTHVADYEAVLCRAPRSIPLVQTKVKERLKPASPLFLAKRKWHMWFVSHSGSVAVHSVWLRVFQSMCSSGSSACGCSKEKINGRSRNGNWITPLHQKARKCEVLTIISCLMLFAFALIDGDKKNLNQKVHT